MLVGGNGTYVGDFPNADRSARFAMVVGSESAVAYVCGTDDDFNDAYSRWFRGSMDASGKFSFTTDGVTISGTFDGDMIQGRISGKFAKPQQLQAKMVDVDSWAGLYRAQDFLGNERFTSGWIVDSSGNIVGATTTQSPTGTSSIRQAKIPANEQEDDDRPAEAVEKPVRGEKIFPDHLRRLVPSSQLKSLSLLPGDRLRARLLGYVPTARSLMVAMNDTEYELPIGIRQLTIIEPDGSRSEEWAVHARGEASFENLDDHLRAILRRLTSEQKSVTIRITGGRVEIRTAPAASRGRKSTSGKKSRSRPGLTNIE
jgi:hypothetical protein